jgi:phosphatidylserine synthase
MVSNVPTFSFKGGNNAGKARLRLLSAGGVLLAFAIEPWITLAVMSTIYILTIPLAYWQQRQSD